MRKILIVALAVLALAFNACGNPDESESGPGTYTGTKDGITYILVIDSPMGAHAVGDAYTFTARGQGIERVGEGKVMGINSFSGYVVFTLQPSYTDSLPFVVYTIDIRIVFIEDPITCNDGSTLQAPGSFTGGTGGGGGGGSNGGGISYGGNPWNSGGNPPVINTYAITTLDDGHGSCTADVGLYAEQGVTVTVYATPNIGYAFQGWQDISGGAILSPDDLSSPATFTMPDNSVTIKALFVPLDPAIEISGILYTYEPLQSRKVSYSYVGGISEAVAGTISIKYIDVNGLEYTHLTGVVDAGVYGIYVSAGGLNGYPVITNMNIGTLIIEKAVGDPVDIPTRMSSTYSSMRINAVPSLLAPLDSGQTVEYAISVYSNADPSDLYWQPGFATNPGFIFDGLTADTVYYIYARSQENNNYLAGVPSMSLPITTPSPPTIRIVEGNISLPEGGTTRPLHVVDDTDSDITASVTWGTSNSTVADFDPITPNLVVSGNQGSARITATYGGATYSVIITVQRMALLANIDGIGPGATSANGRIFNIDADAGSFSFEARGEITIALQIFSFLYIDTAVPGDFTMTVKLENIKFGIGNGPSSAVGIIAVQESGIDPDNDQDFSDHLFGRDLLYASTLLRPAGGTETRWWIRRARSAINTDYNDVRIGSGGATNAALDKGRWIKLRREGATIYSAYSENNGATWVEESIADTLGSVYVGLWVAAGSTAGQNNGLTTAGFSEWSFVYGDGDATQAQLNATSAQINLSNFP